MQTTNSEPPPSDVPVVPAVLDIPAVLELSSVAEVAAVPSEVAAVPSEVAPPVAPDVADIREARKSSLRAASFPSCIFEVLQADHHAISSVFAMLKRELAAEKPDEKACFELFQRIDALLSPHAHAEEELTYRAFAGRSREAEAAIAEAFEEHELIHALCGELRRKTRVDGPWRAKAQVLMSVVELHNQKEAASRFALAKQLVDPEESYALAKEYLATKEQIAAKLGLPLLEPFDLPAGSSARLAAS